MGKEPKVKKTNGEKVWRIWRFWDRFELPDDTRFCRKGPLNFVRMFVGSGTDDESIGFAQSLEILSHREDFDLMEISFFRLLRHAANRSRCYRGYILNMAVQPASAREIGQILNKDTIQAKTILKVLAEAKLIEQVDCPAFDPAENEPPSDPSPDDNSGRKQSRKVSFSGNSERARKCFKKTANSNVSKTASGNGKKKREKKAAAPQAERRGRIAPSEAETLEGQGDRQRQGPPEGQAEMNAETREGQGDRQTPKADASASPTAAPPKRLPIQPTNSDGSGTRNGVSSPGYRTSVLVQNLERMYDPTGMTFAREIYAAIGCPHAAGTIEAARELGNFAAAWCYAKQARLPPGALQTLWDKSVKNAAQIGRKRRRFRKPEAGWRSIFNKRLQAYCQQRETGT